MQVSGINNGSMDNAMTQISAQGQRLRILTELKTYQQDPLNFIDNNPQLNEFKEEVEKQFSAGHHRHVLTAPNGETPQEIQTMFGGKLDKIANEIKHSIGDDATLRDSLPTLQSSSEKAQTWIGNKIQEQAAKAEATSAPVAPTSKL